IQRNKQQIMIQFTSFYLPQISTTVLLGEIARIRGINKKGFATIDLLDEGKVILRHPEDLKVLETITKAFRQQQKELEEFGGFYQITELYSIMENMCLDLGNTTYEHSENYEETKELLVYHNERSLKLIYHEERDGQNISVFLDKKLVFDVSATPCQIKEIHFINNEDDWMNTIENFVTSLLW
ncbi:MAG: hypothetical protein ACFBSE_17070, partial [Prochloraceae cyanobacterium]